VDRVANGRVRVCEVRDSISVEQKFGTAMTAVATLYSLRTRRVLYQATYVITHTRLTDILVETVNFATKM